MALAPPITDVEQLKSHPALGRLVEWNASVVQAVPPEEIGPHCTPPVIFPLEPLSTHAVGPVE